MKILNKYRVLISLPVLISAFTINCWPWGQKGHDVTAAIAERHLTPTTKVAIDSIMEGKSIIYWANWLDNASHTSQYEYSKTWHYKNIDPEYSFETAPLNTKGDVIMAVNENIAKLKDKSSTMPELKLALKMLIHLVGDMHQPMHLGRYSDRGGNKYKVKFFNRDTNLHSIWDSNILESGHKWSYSEWTDQIDRINDIQISEYTSDDITDWAKETYNIACEIYETTPEDTNISYDYIAGWTPTIEQQLLRGGIRLAYLLNSIFDYNGK